MRIRMEWMIAFLVDDTTQVVYDIMVKSSLKDAF